MGLIYSPARNCCEFGSDFQGKWPFFKCANVVSCVILARLKFYVFFRMRFDCRLNFVRVESQRYFFIRKKSFNFK